MEPELIQHLRNSLASSPRLRIGLGDDAAILHWHDREDLVVTTDLISDEIDFLLAEVDPRRVGRKALAVNLSDLAAMGAEPIAAVVSLLLPKRPPQGTTLELATKLYEGMLPLCEQFDCVVAGGDTNSWSGPLAISVTAFGSCGAAPPLLRSAAKPGDVLLVTGQLGGSIVGHHFDFTPRVNEARKLAVEGLAHAAMDISDGLLLDLSRMLKESAVSAVVDLPAVPVSPAAAKLAESSGKTPLQHALSDGEDFELLFTASPEAAAKLASEGLLGTSVTVIGTLVAGEGIWADHVGGKRLEPQGFLHQ
ncbi:thiamine-phosphate kinase [Blastopirellula sp. JC732]|uniref:Thiamine-monophosphate kinase n=1 Tax=Blastopirellula sediminis TaxID=2894196 RepID=A0A9X1SHQ5_9BACT|nr:thiamine-phosphate kinase [Blastopirellula sediminis]MCC9607803.1 thiamine-phosphate kinase [Blastopirellula sediminis]MCC9627404.1 thiamine-phosphate kinase [Blastopirellula sediminis]